MSNCVINKEEFGYKFNKSVYRKGVSAYIYGGLRGGISDHLPVSFDISPVGISDSGEMLSPIKAASWNLLSDDHLWNNFMNITGSVEIKRSLSAGNIYRKTNNLYHFFCEISQFLYDKHMDGKSINSLDFEITSAVLASILTFGEPDKTITLQPSQLTRSRDKLKVAGKIDLVKRSRKELINEFYNKKKRHLDPEFELAIKHSMEIVYHIKNKNGSLRWKNRFELLANDKGLLSDLKSHDIICLQECNDPDQIVDLLNSGSDKYDFIKHNIRKGSLDNCVIIYDKNRFELIKNTKFALGNSKKPAILASFEDKNNQSKPCVIGSIHHPGGDHYEMDKVQDEALKLINGVFNAPIMILGDHNNTKQEFSHNRVDDVFFETTGPETGTMAGIDHGLSKDSSIDLCSHINCKIDDSRVIEQKIRGGYSKTKLLLPVAEEVVPNGCGILSAFFGLKCIPKGIDSSQRSEI